MTLVGAGCGPADLITLRGLDALRQADVIVYDALSDLDLLQFAAPTARCIYAGKRSGKHSMPQAEINRLLIDLAWQGARVCRLKGGDPFVFGRGGEECDALQKAGVPCCEVPGVTSAIAVPAAAGIPVTHRGVSRSFHVITAHTASSADGLPDHLDDLARMEGTLVFLMGLQNLSLLSRRLISAGMPDCTPAAVCGCRTVRGTLADIVEKAEDVLPPAVIVIGGSAWMDLQGGNGLLHGAVVGLTGTMPFRQRARRVFAWLGAVTFDAQQTYVRQTGSLDRLREALTFSPGWIVFTSPNGVRKFFQMLRAAKVDIRRFGKVRFAVVGPGTAAALAQNGIFTDIVPEIHSTAALGAALAQQCLGSSVLFVSGERYSPAPQQALNMAGIPWRRLTLYRTETSAPSSETMDYLVFGSAAEVQDYFTCGGNLPRRAAVCIGAATAAAASAYCTALTAADTTAEAMAAAVSADWLTTQAAGIGE